MAKPTAKPAVAATPAAKPAAAVKPAAKKPAVKKAVAEVKKVFKEAIVEAVHEKHTDLTKKRVFDITTDIVSAIVDNLRSGVAVNLNDLGTLSPKVVPAKKGAKLPDGRVMDLPERKTVRFGPSTKIFRAAEPAAAAAA